MKKHLLYLVFPLALIIGSCQKDHTKPHNSKSGKYLENYTAYFIPFKFGEADESQKFIWESKAFNSDSTVKEWQYRAGFSPDPEENDLWSKKNTYENGRLKEKIEMTTSKERKVYHYSNNRLVNIDGYDENGLLEKYNYKYSGKSDNPDTLYYYWMFFDKPTLHVYSYDIRGNKIEDSTVYYTQPYGILRWKYDSHNNMIEETYYSSKDNKTTTQEIRKYSYDNNGKVIQYIFSAF